MRHRVKLNHLGRKTAHRKALLSHLSCELIRHKRIITTLAKAKALRVYVEPLITKSKINTTHQRRIIFSYLQDKEAVTELFSEISAKIGTRPGGYTRIIKLGARKGDAAEMALIELVDYNEIYSNEPVDTGKKKRTRRGGSRSKKTTPAEDTQAAESSTGVASVEDATSTQDKTVAEKQPEEEAKIETAPKEEKPEASDNEAKKEVDDKEAKEEVDDKEAKKDADDKEAKKDADDKENKKTEK